jgi:hypothetical protein
MNVKVVLFRYQPNLAKDKWFPIGIVVERSVKQETEIAVVCLQQLNMQATMSELAAAMLRDVPSILRKEVEGCRIRLKSKDDFLEALRAGNQWNFHFSVPEPASVEAEDILEAAFILFHKKVLRELPGLTFPMLSSPMRLQPSQLECYALAV